MVCYSWIIGWMSDKFLCQEESSICDSMSSMIFLAFAVCVNWSYIKSFKKVIKLTLMIVITERLSLWIYNWPCFNSMQIKVPTKVERKYRLWTIVASSWFAFWGTSGKHWLIQLCPSVNVNFPFTIIVLIGRFSKVDGSTWSILSCKDSGFSSMSSV